MPQVHFSPYFGQTYVKAAATYGAQIIKDLMLDFVQWKEQGINPRGMTDKSSAKDDAGVVYRPYQRLAQGFCHLRSGGNFLIRHRWVLPMVA